MELTKEDLMVLIEAVGSWECKEQNEAVTSSLIGMMMSKDKEEAKKHTEEVMTMSKVAHEEKMEIATCLKAKLILMKNKL